jgi:hypothetical protein
LLSSVFLLFISTVVSQTENKPWSIVLLPGTQDYTRIHPEIFVRQTEWVASQKDERNIKLVLHLGDITDNNTHPQWLSARDAMNVLVRAKIPFALTPGEHDLGEWGTGRDRTTFMGEYFGWFDYRDSPFVNKSYYYERGHLENAWLTVDTPWGPVIVIALELFPRDKALEWAKKAVARHSDHHAILLTHAYLYNDNTRYDWVKNKSQIGGVGHYEISRNPEGANDGEQMWRKLVSQQKNFLFTFSGHALGDGAGYLASKGKYGNEVHQIMANYQAGVNGGNWPGYLRILEFQPDRKTIKIFTYSPYLDKWLTDAKQQFIITLAKEAG